jgi:serine/threonine protein kinase
MTYERWKKLSALFHEALELQGEARAAFLAEACGDDRKLRKEAEGLIAAHEMEGSFIDSPILLETADPTGASRIESPVGRRIGPYHVVSQIGRGGTGEVFLAEDTRLERKVALKVLPVVFRQNPDRVRRFEREAKAASALNHPNILTIHEIGEASIEDGGAHYIVSEFVEGETLRAMIKRGRLSVSQAIAIAEQVASALGVAHEAGIIHRDIKPENVMARPDGLVKVLDFGLAKLTERPTSRPKAGGDSRSPAASRLSTEPGAVMGTVSYMSPEQARGLKVDHRTDIFSLGVMLFEMLAGQRPFEGATTSDVVAAILTKEPEPLEELRSEAGPELAQAVMRCLAKEREERFQTTGDLSAQLRAATERGKQSPPGKAWRGTRTIRIAAAFAIMALVAVAYWKLAPKAAPDPQIRSLAELPPTLRGLSRLTYDQGLQSEPAWSPDGKMIAYSSDRSGNFDLWVQPVSEGNPVQVTTSPAHDWQPDWSPDGTRLVFRSERDGGGLFIVPALGGAERKIAGFGCRPRWSPDGSRILFYSSTLQNVVGVPKVYLAELDGKPPQELAPEFLGEFDYLRVAWHPDGQRISLWGRHLKRPHLGWSFWTISLSDGSTVKSEISAQVEQQLKTSVRFKDFSNFLWAPSGQALYFEGSFRGVRNLWRVEVEPQTLRWITGPERLTTDPGPDTEIAISPDGKKLAYTIRTERTRIWSLPFNATTGRIKGAGQPVTSADKDAWKLDLSRDGRKLVFAASRAGKEELWEKSIEDGRETLLRPADDFTRYSPRWSRDGLRLVYRRDRGTDPEQARFEFSIVQTPTGGGDEQLVTFPSRFDEFAYDWSADGEWILGNTERHSPGRYLIGLFPLRAAPHAENQMRVVTSHPEYSLWQPRFSPDERWICFNALKASEAGVSTIYVVPSSGGDWTRVTEGRHWEGKARWSPDGRTIYFVSNRTGFFNVWGIRFDRRMGKPVGEAFRVTEFESPGRMVLPLLGRLEMALATDRLVLPIMEVSGSIWILENVDH